MEACSSEFDTQADTTIGAGVAMDICPCIILCRICHRLNITRKPDVSGRNPDTKPLVTTGSFLTVGAVTENLVYRLSGEFELHLATFTATFAHLLLLHTLRLNQSMSLSPGELRKIILGCTCQPDYKVFDSITYYRVIVECPLPAVRRCFILAGR